MLQAHSYLWHYLWLAPHVLQLGLAVFLWRRGFHRVFPVFLAYTVFEAVEEFTLYALDVMPSVSPETFWVAFTIGLIVEGLLKFAIAGELFLHLVGPWPALAKTGNRMITSAGVLLVLAAGIASGLTIAANPNWFISGPHLLQQALYIVESGLILFILAFATYFKLAWNRQAFGIAMGLGFLSCEHLAVWALSASGALAQQAYLFDFLNLATYHACVLVWIYYFVVGEKLVKTFVGPLPPHPLDSWNRELERLLQQ